MADSTGELGKWRLDGGVETQDEIAGDWVGDGKLIWECGARNVIRAVRGMGCELGLCLGVLGS